MARALRAHLNLPEEFSWYAVKYSQIIYNFVSIKSVTGRTPYEAWMGKKPVLSMFVIFGCRCWIKNPSPEGKFGNRAKEDIFLGLSDNSKSYICYSTETNRILYIKDVAFNEHQIPGIKN